MSKAIAGFTMSLDGFIAEPDHGVGRLFKWYFGGNQPFPVPNSDMVFQVSPVSVPVVERLFNHTFGAVLTGRRDFDVSNAWGGQSPLGAPIFIVTHHAPPEWDGTDAPFTFVTDGVERALAQAKAVAGDKPVAVGGTTITRQLLQAGLLDELHIDLAHMLLGDGIPLFERLGVSPIDLEKIHVIDAPLVTHLAFRVVRPMAGA